MFHTRFKFKTLCSIMGQLRRREYSREHACHGDTFILISNWLNNKKAMMKNQKHIRAIFAFHLIPSTIHSQPTVPQLDWSPQCGGITCIPRIASISAGPTAMMQTTTSTTTKTTNIATRLLLIAYSSNDKNR